MILRFDGAMAQRRNGARASDRMQGLMIPSWEGQGWVFKNTKKLNFLTI